MCLTRGDIWWVFWSKPTTCDALLVRITCLPFDDFLHVPLSVEWILQIKPRDWAFFFGPMIGPKQFPIKFLLIFLKKRLTFLGYPLMSSYFSGASRRFVKKEESGELERVTSGIRVLNVCLVTANVSHGEIYTWL